jgi:hypothetical protein
VLPLTSLEFSLNSYQLQQGVALDVLGNREVPLFHHTNTGVFLPCPLEHGKYDTCRLPNHLEPHPTPYGIWDGLHIQTIRKQGKS